MNLSRLDGCGLCFKAGMMRALPRQDAGKFIVLEGLDGAGTTSQMRALAQWLQRRGYRVHLTQEPSSGPVAKWLRQSLRGRLPLAEGTMALLFLADRLDHVYGPNGVVPLLQTDRRLVVLSDRYYLSSFAYQSSMQARLTPAWLYAVHAPVPRPHLTVFVDVPAEVALTRIIAGRGFHFERYEVRLERLVRVREQYHRAIAFLRERGDTIFIVDGDAAFAEVQRRLRRAVADRLAWVEAEAEVRQVFPFVEPLMARLWHHGLQVSKVQALNTGVQLRVFRRNPLRAVTVTVYMRRGRVSQVRVQGYLPLQARVRQVLQQFAWSQAGAPWQPSLFAEEDEA